MSSLGKQIADAMTQDARGENFQQRLRDALERRQGSGPSVVTTDTLLSLLDEAARETPEPDREFPKVLYKHETGETRTVASADEEAPLLDAGWQTSPPPDPHEPGWPKWYACQVGGMTQKVLVHSAEEAAELGEGWFPEPPIPPSVPRWLEPRDPKEPSAE